MAAVLFPARNPGEVCYLDRVIAFPGGPGREHVITDQPMRLRWGPWRVSRVIQAHVGAAAVYEDFRADCLRAGRDPSAQMPPHFSLEGGLQDTALALLRHRADAQAQARVCYLAALLEALLNAPSPVLRSDLIRRVYQEVERLSAQLSLRWRGGESRFIPPVNQDAADPRRFERTVASLATLREFLETIQALSQERYQILSRDYVFYYPPRLRHLLS
ncbi:MAG: hypothetical protein C4525_17115 [Desulfarculus sp.]|nr:MAG: hypothetical protein C4525_17115 [Desulfarculus sp.]